MSVSGLKNVNMLSKEQFNGIANPSTDELYAVSGSGFGFPSNRYENLTLGASGSTYTAPANGYFYISKRASAVNQYFQFYSSTRGMLSRASTADGLINFGYEVQKGEKVTAGYSVGGALTYFRFVYAEGE